MVSTPAYRKVPGSIIGWASCEDSWGAAMLIVETTGDFQWDQQPQNMHNKLKNIRYWIYFRLLVREAPAPPPPLFSTQTTADTSSTAERAASGWYVTYASAADPDSD